MDSGNAREFYLLYARLEEKFGGLRHCMDVLDRATTAVPAGEKLEVYLYYAGKVSEYYGASKTREIWTRAMETVPAGQVKEVAGAVCGPGDEAGGVGPCPRDLRVCGAVLQPADGGEFLGRLAGI